MNYELRMKLEEYQRGRITWSELGEWLDARIMFTPRCPPDVTVFNPHDPAIQLLPEGTRIAVYRQVPDAVERGEDPELRLPPRVPNGELPTTVAQRFLNRNYERPPVAWMHWNDPERCISVAVKSMGQRAGGMSAVWVGAYTLPPREERMKSILVEVELSLQRPNDLRDIGAVRAAVSDHAHCPVRAALLGRHADHPSAVHIGLLAPKPWQGFNSLDQHLLQLLCGAGRLSHGATV